MNNNDKKLICKDCGEEFIFKSYITEEDFSKENKEEGKQLLLKREELNKKIMKLKADGKISEIQMLEPSFLLVERLIVVLSNGNSQEAYKYNDLNYEPSRCSDCRRKLKEKTI